MRDIAEEAYDNEMNKIAGLFSRLNVSDVDKALGLLVNKGRMKDVAKQISKANTSKFILRHPNLTGIPTLGVAPYVSRNRAAKDIATKLRRASADLDIRSTDALSDRVELMMRQRAIARTNRHVDRVERRLSRDSRRRFISGLSNNG